MTDWDIYQEIPIPPRGAESLTVSFLRGIITAEFNRDGHKIPPKSVKTPAFLSLSHSVRPDGSLSVASALAFLERYDAGHIPGEIEVSIDSNLYRLTPQDRPRELTLNFIFNGKDCLEPVVEAWGQVFCYDGHGVFLSAQGDYFSLDGVMMADAFLDASRHVPATHFGLFFKLLLPRISQTVPTVCSLTLTAERPVLFTPIEDRQIEVKWQLPYEDITFFPSNNSLCEAYGNLLPSSGELASLSDIWQKDGRVVLTPPLFREINRLYTVQPALFASQPRFQETSTPKPPPPPVTFFSLDGEPSSPEFRIPDRPKPEITTLSPLGAPGLLCRKQKSPPANLVRSSQLLAFLRQYGSEPGPEVTPVPYSAFSPCHRDLNKAQRETYFYARACYLRGEILQVDYAYLLLLVYEACNLPNRLDFMIFLWKTNRERFTRLDLLFPGILRDYIVLRHPEISLSSVIERVGVPFQSLPYPEMFLDLTSPEGLASLPFGYYSHLSDYDFTKSKFYTAHRDELSEAFRRALQAADRFIRDRGGKGLLASSKSHRVSFRTSACSPAVLTPENSCTLTYEYDSFLGDPALLHTVGNLFKVTENLLRSRLSFRGHLKTEPLEPGMEKALTEALTPRKVTPPISLNISAALSIEEESWDTTERLLAEAGSDETPEAPPATPVPPPEPMEEPASSPEPDSESSPYRVLWDLLSEGEQGYLLLLFREDAEDALSSYCRKKMLLPDSLEESINEKSLELTGDILIESHMIIDDYREDCSFLSTIE